TARAAVAAVTTIAPVTARAAVETAVAVAALVAVALLHHRGGTFLVRLDPKGDEAQDVLVDAHLALHLGHGRGRGVDVDQREMRLAVLLDTVGERLDAPVLGLADGAAVRLDDALELFDEGLDLLCGNILACQEDVLVESH